MSKDTKKKIKRENIPNVKSVARIKITLSAVESIFKYSSSPAQTPIIFLSYENENIYPDIKPD